MVALLLLFSLPSPTTASTATPLTNDQRNDCVTRADHCVAVNDCKGCDKIFKDNKHCISVAGGGLKCCECTAVS
ncbi:hypothetical protein SUGI_0727900 [Cryptomeria japonica]|nr:hypothetical protein SUGI_0727900 [Cryptomeria japonica]